MTAFISYDRRDESSIVELHADVERVVPSAWLDRDIEGGQLWWEVILDRIRTCDLFIYTLSPDSLVSEACQAELSYALALERTAPQVLVRKSLSGHDCRVWAVTYNEPGTLLASAGADRTVRLWRPVVISAEKACQMPRLTSPTRCSKTRSARRRPAPPEMSVPRIAAVPRFCSIAGPADTDDD
jgi:hypothetical protein